MSVIHAKNTMSEILGLIHTHRFGAAGYIVLLRAHEALRVACCCPGRRFSWWT
jgi:hypothetical protein